MSLPAAPEIVFYRGYRIEVWYDGYIVTTPAGVIRHFPQGEMSTVRRWVLRHSQGNL